MNRSFFYLLLPLYASLAILSGCGSTAFDRDKAVSLINKTFELPKLIPFGLVDARATVSDFNIRGEEALQEAGYRNNIVEREFQEGGFGLYMNKSTITFQISEKAKPFIKESNAYPSYTSHILEIGKYKIDSIINFRQISENEYEIEFVLIPVLNEIGQLVYLNFTNNSFINNTTVPTDQYDKNRVRYEYKIMRFGSVFKLRLLKYDDGWKVASDDVKKMNEQMTPGYF